MVFISHLCRLNLLLFLIFYFRPERFLSKDEKSVQKHESLIPFSIGRRACIGETLARDTYFLFTVCLVQNFKIIPNPEEPMPTFEINRKLTHSPLPFSVIMKEIN